MIRVFVLIASAAMLGGCASSWMPSTDWIPTGSLGSPQPVSLRLESEPPGAEARTGAGQACRTPCTLALPPSGDVAVTFSLAGYKPEVVPVKVLMPGDPRGDPDAVSSVQFNPNPVVAALEPAPLPPAAQRKTAPKTRATAKPAAAAAPRPAAAPAQTNAPGMIPGSVPTSPPPGSPWPPLQR